MKINKLAIIGIDRITAKLNEILFCKWKKYDNNFDDICYETACGKIYYFPEESIKENEYMFCPYCGKRIKERQKDEQWHASSVLSCPSMDYMHNNHCNTKLCKNCISEWAEKEVEKDEKNNK